jgi:hypothetical protein
MIRCDVCTFENVPTSFECEICLSPLSVATKGSNRQSAVEQVVSICAVSADCATRALTNFDFNVEKAGNERRLIRLLVWCRLLSIVFLLADTVVSFRFDARVVRHKIAPVNFILNQQVAHTQVDFDDDDDNNAGVRDAVVERAPLQRSLSPSVDQQSQTQEAPRFEVQAQEPPKDDADADDAAATQLPSSSPPPQERQQLQSSSAVRLRLTANDDGDDNSISRHSVVTKAEPKQEPTTTTTTTSTARRPPKLNSFTVIDLDDIDNEPVFTLLPRPSSTVSSASSTAKRAATDEDAKIAWDRILGKSRRLSGGSVLLNNRTTSATSVTSVTTATTTPSATIETSAIGKNGSGNNGAVDGGDDDLVIDLTNISTSSARGRGSTTSSLVSMRPSALTVTSTVTTVKSQPLAARSASSLATQSTTNATVATTAATTTNTTALTTATPIWDRTLSSLSAPDGASSTMLQRSSTSLTDAADATSASLLQAAHGAGRRPSKALVMTTYALVPACDWFRFECARDVAPIANSLTVQ